MSTTPRLSLPFLSAGQAQKEFFHNEALQSLDMLVAAVVEELPRGAPPTSPQLGACYIVAAAPSAEWAGKAQCIAAYTAGGWRFVTPFPGLRAFVKSDDVFALYRTGAWELGAVRGSSLMIGGQQVVGARSGAIAAPSGGTTVDGQARTAVAAILSALRQHGLIEP